MVSIGLLAWRTRLVVGLAVVIAALATCPSLAVDCNSNGIDDATDIAGGTSLDCNSNGVPDECEVCGFEWSALGSGTTSSVLTLTVFDDGGGPALYAGGLFITAGGASANRIAKWNGTTWSPLGSGMNDKVLALTVFDDGGGPALYAAGDFTTAGGVSANRIAKWDGGTWSSLGSGTTSTVNALTVFDDGAGPALYAGGGFTFAGGTLVFNIAKWGCTAVGANDCNANGIPDECEPGCNTNGIPDECDIAAGTSQDCNSNGVPDECDTAAGASQDCQLDGIPDECDIAAGTSQDCNTNGIPDECEPDCNANGTPDECDIAAGEPDCNSNGTPDVCEPVGIDCNSNGVDDLLDVCAGTSADCNANGIPDECDVAGGTSADCNTNGFPDECDIAGGAITEIIDAAGDGAGNGLDLAQGIAVDAAGNAYVTGFLSDNAFKITPSSPDCNSNGIPDECGISFCTNDPACDDCNNNGVPDGCDVQGGTSSDADTNGIPDECIEWTGAQDNLWSTAANWDDNIVPNNGGGLTFAVTIEDTVVIARLIPAVVNLDITALIDSLRMLNGASLDMTGGDLSIATTNGILNDGTITVQPPRQVVSEAPIALTGNGVLRLNGTTAKLSSLSAADTITSTSTVAGVGTIDAGLVNTGPVSADGAGQSLVVTGSNTKVNNGQFRATNTGTLLITDTHVTGTGTYRANGGSIRVTAGAGGASVIGATARSGNGGFLEVADNVSIDLSGQLLIDSGGKYQAATGLPSAALTAGNVAVMKGLSGAAGGEINLIGTMSVETPGDFVLDGTGAVPCWVRTPGGARGGDTPPVLKLRLDAELRLGGFGALRLLDAVVVVVDSAVSVSLRGDFDNRINNTNGQSGSCFDWDQGGLLLDGTTPQTFEVAGNDVGTGLAAMIDNFTIGDLTIAGGADVAFVDQFDNNGAGQLPCTEALYVRNLDLQLGSTITVTNCKVYYNDLVDSGATVNLVGCGVLVHNPTGDFNGDGVRDAADIAAFGSCLGGPTSTSLGPGCGTFDFDSNGRVDLLDYGLMQIIFSN